MQAGGGLTDKLLTNKKFLHQFQETLYLETLRSQRISCFIILIVAFLIASAWAVLGVFFRDFINSKLDQTFPFNYLVGVIYTLVFYEFISILILNYFIKQKRQLPIILQYMNAMIEISFVSIAMLFVGTHMSNSSVVLSSPGFSLYFLFIFISALKLDKKLSIFTGFFSAASYVFCVYYLKGIASQQFEIVYFSPVLIIGRALPLIIAGMLVGFTAQELKKRIYISLNNINTRNAVISLFGQYVSPIVVDKIIHQKTNIKPESRHVCILFLDIRNFTSFSDTHKPEAVIKILNSLFKICIEIVNQHHGFINKFLGDGFMAVFGAPIPDQDDSLHACDAAFAILKKIELMSENGDLPQIRVGIGLHAGLALTGSVGSEERKEYTVIGDTVNIAARIEQLNKEFRSQLIVSETVVQFVPSEHQILETHTVQIRGKKDTVKVYILA